MRIGIAAAAFAIAALGHTTASAHFFLQTPAAATEQDGLGDPQKAAPCGPNGAGTPTGAITTYAPGETITITIDERIYHPGHYRVALAIDDPAELPPAPPVTPAGNDECASTVIDSSPTFPVLADGMLQHNQAFDAPQSFEVTLPDDITCDGCTLQIIEYMSQHAAPCFYYHCATIAIQEGGTSSSAASTGGGTGSSSGSGTGGAVDDDGGPPLDPVDTSGDGCGLSAGSGTDYAATGLALLLLLGLSRRTSRSRVRKSRSTRS